MFAASRKDRVIGCTNTLIVSVRTKNGFNHVGAPSGRKWAIVFFGCFVSLDRMISSHMGSPIDSVIIRCLVFLNEYGVIPNRFDRIMVTKIVDTRADIPFMCVEYVRDSWEKIVENIGISFTVARFVDGQYDRFSMTIMNVDTSNSGVSVGTTDEYTYGSKVEKMSFIIKI